MFSPTLWFMALGWAHMRAALAVARATVAAGMCATGHARNVGRDPGGQACLLPSPASDVQGATFSPSVFAHRCPLFLPLPSVQPPWVPLRLGVAAGPCMLHAMFYQEVLVADYQQCISCTKI